MSSTPEALQISLAVKLHGEVEGRLPAHGGEDGVRLLALDDPAGGLGGQGLDVGGVGQVRVGHDGGRVGVDQNDAVALALEGAAGLDAGVVELAGLADDDRPGPENEDGL